VGGRPAARPLLKAEAPGKGLELASWKVLPMSLESQTPRTSIQADDLTFRGIDLKASSVSAIAESSDVMDEGINRAPQFDIAQVTDNQHFDIWIGRNGEPHFGSHKLTCFICRFL